MTSEVANLNPEPPLVSAERAAERARVQADATRLATRLNDALSRDIHAIMSTMMAPQKAEIDGLKARLDRLERLLAPKDVEEGGT
jgi:polyhydroxyalkanoate synthesis regulator phasin